MLRKFITVVLFFILVFLSFPHKAEAFKIEGDLVIFQIRIVVDQNYREKTNWQMEINAIVKRANNLFEEQGINARFQIVKIDEWIIGQEEEDFYSVLYKMHEERDKNVDLTIGITAKNYTYKNMDEEVIGLYYSGCILIECFPSQKNNNMNWTILTNILVHEFGHFMDLTHNESKDSVMYEKVNSKRSHFLEAEVLAINSLLNTRYKNKNPAVSRIF